MHTPAALSVIFRQQYLNEQKREYAMNHPQNFLHINHNLTQNERKSCLCSGDTNAMCELDKQNKQNDTEKKEKALSVYELPSKLINFYTLTDARTVSPCNALLWCLSVMALDVQCASKGLMWEMWMSS